MSVATDDWRYQHLQTQPYLRGVRWQRQTQTQRQTVGI